jgi:hypothetical protein
MTKCRLLQVFAALLIVAFFVFGQQVVAQGVPHNYHTQIVHRVNPDGARPAANPAPTDNLYPISQAFVVTPVPIGTNSDGTDLWPCFGGSTANPDCPTIGDPSITFPAGGVALGAPQYVWSYSACDASKASDTTPCGQTETWYEDDSNDTSSTDDLTYSLAVTQVQSGKTVYIADSGIVDFGPNPYGGLSPAADVIIYGDQNFGTLGATGKNNGNCEADFNYPSPVLPGVFVVAANKTCVNPIPGLATVTATTEISTATFTTKKGVTTVKYTTKYKASQKWDIFFQ